MFPYDAPLFWLLAIAGVLITGISKSGFAGGAGVIAVPLLALVIPVPLAAALVLPLLLVMDAKTIALYRHSINLHELKPLLAAAIIGIGLAGSAMALVPPHGLQIALALFSILFACWHRLIPLLGRLPGSAYLWGTLSGISSTLLHAGGPPMNIHLISQQLPKEKWLAQAAVFFGVMNLVKLIPYSLNSLWSWELIGICLLLFPFAWLGVHLGHHMQKRLDEGQFMLICRGLLLSTGIGLLLQLRLN